MFTAAALTPAGAGAADFVVNTSIFDESGTSADRPVARNTTVFHGPAVYDQMDGDRGEACYLDAESKLIELLSPARQVRTRVSLDELLTFVSAMQARALASPQSNPLVRFAAAPQFELTTWETKGRLRLEGDWLEYHVQGKSFPPEMVSTYKAFADWFARLNAARHPGALPPAARLELNDRIAEQGWLPSEIRLTIRNKETSSELVSRHSVVTGLRDEDRQFVQRIDRWRQEFRAVNLQEFGRATR
jgi:hypothetical protein